MAWSAGLKVTAWRPEADVCLSFSPIIDTRNDTACTPLAALWRLVSAIAGVNGVLLLGPVSSIPCRGTAAFPASLLETPAEAPSY